jgi:hypothetical protein
MESVIFNRLCDFSSPAAKRNALPIAKAIKPFLPGTGLVLEVASGSGFHAAVLADLAPQLNWLPSEKDGEGTAFIEQVVTKSDLPNLLVPVILDVTADRWPVVVVNAVFCSNMLHISPWPASAALFKGSSKLLNSGENLIIYGPFTVNSEHTSQSNLRFHIGLREQNPCWGLRDINTLNLVAKTYGFVLIAELNMPSNNFLLVYKKSCTI